MNKIDAHIKHIYSRDKDDVPLSAQLLKCAITPQPHHVHPTRD
jgi:hypothetical protein